MENNLKKETVSKLKALGFYQIAGGIIGLLLTAWTILNLTGIEGVLLLIVSIAAALYFYSIYCGVLLLKKKITGLRYSLINQYLQLVSFSFFGFAFKYVSGIVLAVGIDLTESFYFIFDAAVSSWQISLYDDSAPFIVSFNFVAVFLILFIEKLKKQISKEQLDNQLALIGEQNPEREHYG